MKTYFLFPAIAMMLLACGQRSNREHNSTTSKDSLKAVKESMDHIPSAVVDFITQAAVTNLKEIRMGKIVQERAVEDRVRNYGTMMVKEHTVANQQLDAIAKKAGVTMPADVSPGDKKDEGKLMLMQKKNFDRMYIKQMIRDHKSTIDRFNTAATSKDSIISTYAKSMLPRLHQHLDEALQILENKRKMINNRDISHN